MEQELLRIVEPAPEARPPDASVLERPVIRAACALFACLVCRTKTGWRHQIWCSACGVEKPDCVDCLYWSKHTCKHPAKRKAVGRR